VSDPSPRRYEAFALVGRLIERIERAVLSRPARGREGVALNGHAAGTLGLDTLANAAPLAAPPPIVVDRGPAIRAAILAAIPDATFLIDQSGVIFDLNPAVAVLFPRGRRGLLIDEVCRSPDVSRAVAEAAIGRVVVEIEEWVPVRRRLLVTVTRLEAADQTTLGTGSLMVVVRDVSEQDRLAQMRADFIANASHELRTPLASLSGFVDTLQGPARDDPVARQRFLGIMATQAARMTRLIDDLLSLSRVEMRAHVPPTGIVDLDEVAGDVAQMLEPVAVAHGARIVLERLGSPARIRGDREEIVQVVQNLAHNAIKYGRPKGGTVSLKLAATTVSRRRLSIAVSDDGSGIAPEHLPRLTERFYRVNPTISRDRGGTGLGLAIVKNIVNRHRGELSIDSTAGQGSTFKITFDEFTGSPGTRITPY
jgi:two-component system, OmpR family, phosphate regulon sensor histidine kinase PhoR